MAINSLGQLVEAACVLEARARKPGNVHPSASFADMTYDDFVRSARRLAPVFDRAGEKPVGKLVLEAVRATRAELGKNTNLGIILVLAPLARAREARQPAVRAVLEGLTLEDARQVYEAIRLAGPGGLGESPEQDVRGVPTVTLLEAMRLAGDRDLIARQYAAGFHDVFTLLLPTFEHAVAAGAPVEQAIVQTQLTGLSHLGDTLILRKCGGEVAGEARRRAREVLDRGWPHVPDAVAVLRSFDAWLRGDGHRRNPGATADLLAGVLFLALRRGTIAVPSDLPWESPAL